MYCRQSASGPPYECVNLREISQSHQQPIQDPVLAALGPLYQYVNVQETYNHHPPTQDPVLSMVAQTRSQDLHHYEGHQVIIAFKSTGLTIVFLSTKG